ncbi:MAG: hypothetical protein ACYCQJ_02880 [Nitrososphaerales archaeon]
MKLEELSLLRCRYCSSSLEAEDEIMSDLCLVCLQKFSSFGDEKLVAPEIK